MANIESLLADTRYWLDQGADPAAPPATNVVSYTKGGLLYWRNSSGVRGPIIDETSHDLLDHTGLTGVGGGGAVGNLWVMNKSASQTLTASTPTQITFDTAVIDGGGSVIDLANERFVAPATGFYLVFCTWIWEATVPTTSAGISVKVGSVESIALLRADAATLGANSGISGGGALSLTSGAFVTMWCTPSGAVTPTARGNASVHLATAFTLVRIT